MKSNATILIVDDEPLGLSIFRGLLSADGYQLEYAADGPSALAKAGALSPDLILLDVMMPGMDGFEVARRVRNTPSLMEVPILLVTALDDRDSRLAGIEAGADDFITKPFDRIELRARIRSILRLNRFRRLLEERERFHHLFEQSPCGLLEIDSGTCIREANRAARTLLTRWMGPGVVQCLTGLVASEDVSRLRELLQMASTDPLSAPRAEFMIPVAPPAWVDMTVSQEPHAEGGTFQIALIDRTAERILEEDLRQAQKRAAIGSLASGIAHDFNNLLTVINGFSSMALEKLRAGDQLREMIAQVYKAGERAASLTRQLLAFSRKEIVAPVVLDLDAVIHEVEKMIRRLIGEHITVRVIRTPGLGRIKVDPGHIEQVLFNLAVNARDAMPHGGTLTLATANVPAEGVPGKSGGSVGWVRMTVSDTGGGMTSEVQARIFEPFFTTKERGKGTGLGLATVQGILQRYEGRIRVTSAVGKGTRFDLDFPRYSGDPQMLPGVGEGRSSQQGHETILLAEDEIAVQRFAVTALESAGYTVLEASNGEEALWLAERHSGSIHLLLADAVMPRMGGRDLAGRLQHLLPAIKVLYTSGYDDDAVLLHGLQEGKVPFLHKPYTVTKLLTKVREVLDR